MRADGRTLILGATSGLGLELANQLASRGYKTIEVGSSVKEENWQGQRWRVKCDLRITKSVRSLINKLDDTKVDHFVWAAGVRYPGFQQADLQWRVNVTGPMPLLKWFWDSIKFASPDERCTLSAISSTSADRPRSYEPVYAATKAAQAHFVRSLGAQKLPNVGVILFKPGGMKTPFWNGQRPDVYDSFMDPAKVADLMVELMEDYMEDPELFYEFLIDKGDHPELL